MMPCLCLVTQFFENIIPVLGCVSYWIDILECSIRIRVTTQLYFGKQMHWGMTIHIAYIPILDSALVHLLWYLNWLFKSRRFSFKDCWLGEKERFVLNIYFCSLEKRIRYQFLHTLDNISWRHQYQCHSDVCSCVGCDIRCLANLDSTSAAFGDVNVVPTGRHSRHYFQLWSWKAIQTCVT